MSIPDNNQMEAMMAALREDREKFDQAVGRVDEITETVTSKDRMVRASVDARGRLTALELKGRRWRDLAPPELCTKIVETVHRAQEATVARSAELMTGLLPPGLDAVLRGSPPDFESMLADVLKNAGEENHG
jgi:hypothetical protein